MSKPTLWHIEVSHYSEKASDSTEIIAALERFERFATEAAPGLLSRFGGMASKTASGFINLRWGALDPARVEPDPIAQLRVAGVGGAVGERRALGRAPGGDDVEAGGAALPLAAGAGSPRPIPSVAARP